VVALKRKKTHPTTMSSTTPCSNDTTDHGDGHVQSDRESDAVELPPKKRRQQDYEGSERAIIRLATEEFQVRVCTEYAFPEDMGDKMVEWVKDSWENACEGQESTLTLTHDHIKMVCIIHLCVLTH
jgi:hypothetical protein